MKDIDEEKRLLERVYALNKQVYDLSSRMAFKKDVQYHPVNVYTDRNGNGDILYMSTPLSVALFIYSPGTIPPYRVKISPLNAYAFRRSSFEPPETEKAFDDIETAEKWARHFLESNYLDSIHAAIIILRQTTDFADSFQMLREVGEGVPF